MKASVQYHLRAELQLLGQLRSPIIVTTLPLEVEHFYPGPPTIADFKLKRQAMSRNISSPRLVPGMEDSEPSFAQKAQKFLVSSKVPTLALRLEVEVPTVLQLENVNAVPFRIKIQSRGNDTSDIIQDVPHQVKLESLTVRIEPRAEVRRRIPIRNAGFTTDALSREVDLVGPDAVSAFENAVCIPCIVAPSTGDEAPSPVDPGKLVGFRLGPKTPRDRRGTKL